MSSIYALEANDQVLRVLEQSGPISKFTVLECHFVSNEVLGPLKYAWICIEFNFVLFNW